MKLLPHLSDSRNFLARFSPTSAKMARPVPVSLEEVVEKELDRLTKDGIMTPVMHSEWASPIVVVPKTDGRVRICGDYKVSVNPVLDADQYPLSNIEDIVVWCEECCVLFG